MLESGTSDHEISTSRQMNLSVRSSEGESDDRDTAVAGNIPAYEVYAHRIFSFSLRRANETLFSGEYYEALAQFLIPSISRPSVISDAATEDGGVCNFAVLHSVGIESTGNQGRRVHSLKSFVELDELWKKAQGNRLLFLRGYPSSGWLCRLGVKLDLDYEFLFQHFSNSSQLSLTESYSLPPLSLINTRTIQLTFTSIGSWDNYLSGIDLETVRAEMNKEMKEYTEELNRGQGLSLSDSIVRSFHVFDLKHFSIDQLVSIKLVENDRHWTLLIWTDCGRSLSLSHRGPWRKIEARHSSSSQFLPLPLYNKNANIKKLAVHTNKTRSPDDIEHEAQLPGLMPALSFLHSELGKTIDEKTASVDPFYAIDEILQLHAASEYQFLNLMEEKVYERLQSQDNIQTKINEIQAIKRLVHKHRDHLRDVLEHVQSRSLYGDQLRTRIMDAETAPKAAEAAVCRALAYTRLIRRAESVSEVCHDTMTLLSNDSLVQEAQRSMEQAEGVAKVTFIAFVFVPLAFTTSFFGMNLHELNDSGHGIWLWFVVSVPVFVLSLLAWWMDRPRQRKFWRAITPCFELLWCPKRQ